MAGASDESQDDRTETATSFRREEFRKQGIVAQSREVLTVILFVSVGAALYLLGGHFLRQFTELSMPSFQFSAIEIWTPKIAHEWLVRCVVAWITMVAPLFGVVVVAALLGGVVQVGFHMTAEPLSPNWDRINPVKGFQRLFSLDSATEALKAFVKMAVVFGVAWSFFKSRAATAGHYFQRSVPELSTLLLGDLARLFFTIAAALGAFAALDYFYQRYRIEKQMRMTKREVKEEYKLREGDPMIKSRIRSAQRRIARRRMMEAIPKADVVVTNPTHYAVALKYEQGKHEAPRVVAKGVDFLALRIRELAKSANVPIVENKPLARALYKQIPIGKQITKDLYTAVAQVLSYVYRVRGMQSAMGATV